MNENNDFAAINGKLAPGDLVLSVDILSAKFLVGTVIDIDRDGLQGLDMTENDTGCAFVNFADSAYSERRLAEMAEHERYYFGRGRKFDRSSLSEVMLLPNCLLRLEGVSPEDLAAALAGEAGAEALCRRLLAEVGLGIDRDGAVFATTEKLYSPLSVALGRRDWQGGYYTLELPDVEAVEHFDAIHAALLAARLPEEEQRGLMAYYNYGDDLGEKVRSITVDTELVGGRLWGVATLELAEALTAEDRGALEEYLIGQYGDGFGEGFEQREIKVKDGDLYVHLWQADDKFFFVNPQELAQRIARETLAANESYGGAVVGGAMTTMKLYSPLEFYMHHPREEEESGEYGTCDLYDEQYRISHEEAFDNLDAIELTLRREVDSLDKTQGLAEYLPDELQAKVLSLFPTIELVGGELYFVATAELIAALTEPEMALLKDEVSGQWSDGFGEGLEQREIQAWHDTVIYMAPWSSGAAFFIDTEHEFRRRLGLDAPEAADLAAAVAPPAELAAMLAVEPPASGACARGEQAREDYDGYTSVLDKINADKAAKQARKDERKRDGDGEDVPTRKIEAKRKRGDDER